MFSLLELSMNELSDQIIEEDRLKAKQRRKDDAKRLKQQVVNTERGR